MEVEGGYDKYTFDGVDWQRFVKGGKINSEKLESPLIFPGGRRISIRTLTSDDVTTITDDLILVNAVSGEITVGLPNASDCNGQMFLAKKIDDSVNLVNLSTDNLIEGLSVRSLSNQYDYVVLIASSGTWYIIT
jgi:glutamine amidotransferase PdxT